MIMTGKKEVKSRFDVMKYRDDFPILKTKIRGKDLIYFDNAATTQKPQQVIDTLIKYYSETNSNIHRAAHFLAEKATSEYEDSRKKIADYLGAEKEEEIVFVRGTSEAINLVARTFGDQFMGKGDEIILSEMEHHSNTVPWQMLAERTGAVIKYIPVKGDGSLDMIEYDKLLTKNTKLVSVVYVSNSLGTVNPVREIIEKAHKVGAKVLLDSAQAVAHITIDVKELDVDFLAFSGHKIYAPTGIGVLYGKYDLLEEMPPFMGGGEMIKKVTLKGSTYNGLPYKFEAGTPNIAGAIALGSAIDYVQSIGLENIARYEKELLDYLFEKAQEIDGLEIYCKHEMRAGVLSFKLGNAHPSDVGAFLDAKAIAVRTGHHCTQPLMNCFGIVGMARASICFYNTKEEIDTFVSSLSRINEMLK
jgi:cysteine desulfurase / selenocysteine lyase